MTPNNATRPSLQLILSVVANHYECPVAAIVGPSRHVDIRHPRQVAMYLACRLAGLSVLRLGEAFNRDHTTVLHGRNVIGQLADGDSERSQVMRNDIRSLIEKINSQRLVSPDVQSLLSELEITANKCRNIAAAADAMRMSLMRSAEILGIYPTKIPVNTGAMASNPNVKIA